MSAEHHRRRSDLFLEAARLDGAQRRAFLDEACGEDAALRREVERMLAVDHGQEEFLEAPALGPGFNVRTDGGAYENAEWPAPAVAAPESIGPYRILGVLGDGGMGVVYRAEQINPRRTVALKVLRRGHRGSYDRDAVRRFELEAQVLARLQHPNIAHVYEAGSYHDPALGVDRPFLAMELVEGVPLPHYIAERTLDVPGKLGLMLQICDAVEHAHQRGVIHRDLKPANILVEAVGSRLSAVGEAEPRREPKAESRKPTIKVLDFGIARVVADDWQATMVTSSGQLLGTLAYMSPEQIELDSAAIDTRADVYALGVMLYELLTGSLPHDVRGKTLPQIVQTLRDEEPRPLGRTARALRGDLSVITAKALERDRERRYASVAAFAADLRRYLAGEPISARPQTTVYQLRKFARRHKELVAGLAAVFLALVLGVIGLSKYAVDLSRARAEAVAARDAERMRSEQLQHVAAFQAAMLSGIDVQLMGLRWREDLLAEFRVVRERAIPAGGHEARLPDEFDEFERLIAGISFTDLALNALDRNVLRRALEAIDRDFADQPLVRATLLQSVGDTLDALGMDDEALAPVEAALALRRELLGEDHPDTLASLHSKGFILSDLNRLDEAEPCYLAALDGRRRVLGEDHPLTLKSIARMSILRWQQGRMEESLEYGREALEGYLRVLGEDHAETLLALHAMAPPAYALGDLATAETYNRRALEGRRQLFGPDHPDTLTSVNNMSVILAAQGRREESLEYAVEALEGRSRVLGREHSQTLQAMSNLASGLIRLNRHAEAEPLLREALETTIRLRGEEHAATFLMTANLGDLLVTLGQTEEAEVLLSRALEGRRRMLGEHHIETLDSHLFMINLLRKTERLADAEQLGVRMLHAMEQTLAPDHWRRSTFLNEHAQTLALLRRFHEAEAMALQAHGIVAAALGDSHPQAARAVEHIIQLYQQWESAEPTADARIKRAQWQARSK